MFGMGIREPHRSASGKREGLSENKPIRWSPHAVQRFAKRAVDPEEAHLTIIDPEFVIAGILPRRVHMRRYVRSKSGKAMLIRVVVEETPSEIVVLTVYVTSKDAKYLRGLV
jgi:hypothetical protein